MATRPFGTIILALALFPAAFAAEDPNTPHYTAEGVTNAASYEQGRLSPYSIGTIFGENLSNTTRQVLPGDVSGGMLPTTLAGADTRVYQDGSPVGLFYVSPTQINFLVRGTLIAGRSQIRVARGVISGPPAELQITEAAPAFFQLDERFVVASHADGTVVLPANPAHPGEVVVFWVTGLGRTYETWQDRSLAVEASELLLRSQLDILLDGVAIDPRLIKYAGTTPGYAGLYQINVELPKSVGPNPEVGLRLAGRQSRRDLRIWLDNATPGAP